MYTRKNKEQNVIPILGYWSNRILHRTLVSFDCCGIKLQPQTNLDEARTLHALLLVLGFFQPTCPHTSSFASQLVNVFVNFGSLQHAFLTFRALLHKPNIAWNAILRGLVGVGHFTKAIHFSHSMLQHEVTPDNYTYPLVLKACSSLCVLELGRWVHDTMLYNELHCKTKANVYVKCVVIGMFAKCGSVECNTLYPDIYINK